MTEIRTFGPFEFRPNSFELTREGKPVDVRPQPAKALALLTSRPGRTVTREEFHDALWSGTHVDFSKSLPFCILQLRRSLGDDATSPEYVETIPRIGYRFMIDVEVSLDASMDAVPDIRRPRRYLTSVAALVLASVAVVAMLPRETSPPSVALKVNVTLPEASELYDEGVYLLEKRTRAGIEASIDRFKRATVADPEYVDAWVALAEAEATLLPWSDAKLETIRVALDKALELDPDNAPAHLRLGQIKLMAERDFAAAEEHLRLALRLDPTLAEAWHQLARLAAILGEDERSVDLVRRARQVDPVSVSINGDATWLFLGAGLPREAEEQARRTLGLQPGCLYTREGLVESLFARGSAESAFDEARPILESLGASQDQIDHVASMPDIEASYRQLYLELVDRETMPPMTVAIARAACGDRSGSLELLETAVESPDPMIVYQIRDPRLTPIKSDPRYEAALARLNL